jgi:hypothetical protein
MASKRVISFRPVDTMKSVFTRSLWYKKSRAHVDATIAGRTFQIRILVERRFVQIHSRRVILAAEFDVQGENRCAEGRDEPQRKQN